MVKLAAPETIASIPWSRKNPQIMRREPASIRTFVRYKKNGVSRLIRVDVVRLSSIVQV
jgi:hypothetical protein